RQALVYDISYILSPQMNYAVVSMAVTNPRIAAAISSPYTYDYTQASTAETPGLADALAQVWKNLAALIVFPSVFFAAAYVKFMRMDIR
ncbi:MAG: ABC transporter permease, partial [Methanoculleus sp.]